MFRRLLLAATGLAAVPAASPALAEWQVASSRHFVVYSDDKPDNVRAFTSRLERFDKGVRVALGINDPPIAASSRVTVYVLPSISDVQKLVSKNMGDNVAGFYQSRASGPVAFVPRNSPSDSDRTLTPRQILQHEYTHHIMYSSWGDVVIPTWFSEGFAELFATATFRADGSLVIGAVPTYRTYGVDMMNKMPVEKLVRNGPNYHDGLETQVFYGRAWLLSHYLMFDKDRSGQLAAYIAAINSGKPAADSLKLLGVESSLDLKLNSYGARKYLPSVALTPDQVPIGEVAVRALAAGEAAVMPALVRSRSGVDKASAQQVVALARQETAPFPADAGAQNELAEAEFDAGNFALSEAAADRALAADPKSLHALIYKGNAQVALADKAGTTDPKAWQAARRWYLLANKLDPDAPEPLQLFYEAFVKAKLPPTEAAKKGLLYAYSRAPYDLGLRVTAARVLLQQDNIKAARVAIEPLAYSPHGGPIATVGAKMIAALDSGGAKAALAVLDEADAKAKADQKKAG